MAVLFLWQYFIAAPHQREQERIAQQQGTWRSRTRLLPAPQRPSCGCTAAPAASLLPHPPLPKRATPMARAPRLVIDNAGSPRVHLAQGRSDRRPHPERYHDTIDRRARTSCCSRRLKRRGLLRRVRLEGNKRRTLPNGDTCLDRKFEPAPLSPANPVTLTWTTAAASSSRAPSPSTTTTSSPVTDSVENKTATGDAAALFAALSHSHAATLKATSSSTKASSAFRRELTEITYATALKEGGETFTDRKSGWLGITDKYWQRPSFRPQDTVYNAIMKAPRQRRRTRSVLGRLYAARHHDGSGPDQQGREPHLRGAKEVKVIEGYEERMRSPTSA